MSSLPVATTQADVLSQCFVVLICIVKRQCKRVENFIVVTSDLDIDHEYAGSDICKQVHYFHVYLFIYYLCMFVIIFFPKFLSVISFKYWYNCETFAESASMRPILN